MTPKERTIQDDSKPARPLADFAPTATAGHSNGSDPRRSVLERRLAQQAALARFAQTALSATDTPALVEEATAVVQDLVPTVHGPGVLEAVPGPDEVAFVTAIAEMVASASQTLQAVEANRYAAMHDPLTELANRSLILDHLQLALARAERRATLAAVVFIDLDDFKGINDKLGHVTGDELLVGVGERLSHAVRPADTLGRWGGDEFVVVCEDLERDSDCRAIVARIAAAFERPFEVRHFVLHISASIGVAVAGDAARGPASLIQAADADMYRVKRAVGATSRIWPTEQRGTVYGR